MKIKSLVPLFSAALASTVVVATPVALMASKTNHRNVFNNPQEFLSMEETSSSSSNKQDTPILAGEAIFNNFNPKYILSISNENSSFVYDKQNKNFSASIDMGINMDYINSAVYYTALFVGSDLEVKQQSNPEADPIIIPHISPILDKERQNVYNSFRGCNGEEFNDYKNFQYFMRKFNVGTTERQDWANFFWENMRNGLLFIAPVTSSSSSTGSDPYHCFNQKIAVIESGKEYSITLNKYSPDQQSNFWPNAQNIEYICQQGNSGKLGLQYTLDPLKWWTDYVMTLQKLKWFNIVQTTGIDTGTMGQGMGYKPRTVPLQLFDSSDEDITVTDTSKKSLLWMIKKLLLTNFVDNSFSINPKFYRLNETTSDTSFDASTEVLRQKLKEDGFSDVNVKVNAVSSINLTSLISSETKRQKILEVIFNSQQAGTAPDGLAYMQQNYGFELFPTHSGIHYYSPWYTDLMIYNPTETVAQAQEENSIQRRAYNYWKERTVSTDEITHVLPHQLFLNKEQEWRTQSGCVIDCSSIQPFEAAVKVNFKSVEVNDTEIPTDGKPTVITNEDQPGGPNTPITLGDQYKITIRPVEDEDYVWSTKDPVTGQNIDIDFTPENFDLFLYTRTPSEIKSFFDSGVIDTRIYKVNESGEKTQEIQNKAWGMVQVYLDAKEFTNAAPLFVNCTDLSTAASRRDQLNQDIVNNFKDGYYKCNTTASGVSFSFAIPNFGELQTRTEINSGILNGFATSCSFSKTLSIPEGLNIDNIYNTPNTLWENYINYTDKSPLSGALFQVDFSSKKIDLQSAEHNYIFSTNVVPEDYLLSAKLFPDNLTDHWGMQPPQNNTLSLSLNMSDRILNKEFEDDDTKKILYLMIYENVFKQTHTWEYTDYSIQPSYESATFNWSIVNAKTGEPCDDIATISVDPETNHCIVHAHSTPGRVKLIAITQDSTQSKGMKYITIGNPPNSSSTPSNSPVHIGGLNTPDDKIIQLNESCEYQASLQPDVTHIGDSFTFKWLFGSSFKTEEAKAQKLTAQLLLNFNAEDVKNNPDIKNSYQVFNEVFDIKYKIGQEASQPVTQTTQIPIPTDDSALSITFTLKQEYTPKVNYLAFCLGNIDIDGIKTSTSQQVCSISPISVPISTLPSDWSFTAPERYEDKDPTKKLIDDEECFKYRNDTVSTTFVTTSEDGKYAINKDSINFVLTSSSFAYPLNLFRTAWVLESETETSKSYKCDLYDLDPDLYPESCNWLYTVSFTEEEKTNAEKTIYSTVKITQMNDETVMGKLVMNYTGKSLGSILNQEWYTGVNEDDPGGGGGGEDDPVIPPPNEKSIHPYIVTAIMIACSVAALTCGIISIKKYKKAKNKK